MSLDAFLAAARSGLFPTPPPEVRTDHVADPRECPRTVETILTLLPATGAVRFHDLTLGAGEKLRDHRAVPRPVLELFKQGVIDLEQSESFADLIVRPLARGERVELDLASIDDSTEAHPVGEGAVEEHE